MVYSECFVRVGSEEVYYRVYGTGDDVFLILHGWWGSSVSWHKVAESLANAGYCVYVPDLPGFGKTTMSQPYTIDWYARFVQWFVQNLSLWSLFLLWHSNGWRIAIYLVAHGMLSVRKLILNNSAGIVSVPWLRLKLYLCMASFLKFFSFLPWFTFFRKCLYRLAWAYDYWSLWKGFLQTTFRSVVHCDIRALLPMVTIPTCLIWWEKDTYTPLEQWRVMHSFLSHASFVLCSWEKHGIHLSNPDLLVSHILSFVDE